MEKFSLEPQLVTKNGNQFLRLIYDKDRDYFLKEIENQTHTDNTISLSYRIRRPEEGKIIYITDVRTAHRSRSGLLLGYEGVLLDNSRQLIAENRLTSTAWKETLANITSGLVHDFSNIMSGIYSLSELYHSLINEKHPWAHGINQIKKNSMEAQNLVRRIIDLNRDLNSQRNIHNIENLIRDQLDLIQVVISKNTHLRTEFTGEELPVYIDEVSFRQVLLNLTLNARDALENNGEIAIAVKKVKEGETVFKNTYEGPFTAEVDGVIISYKDNGSGIKEDYLSKIFDPYFSTKEDNKGSGLGLYNARLFVENHRGRFAVSSHPDKGTSFYIFLPISDYNEVLEEDNPTDENEYYYKNRPNVIIYFQNDIHNSDLVSLMRRKEWEVITFSDNHSMRKHLRETKCQPHMIFLVCTIYDSSIEQLLQDIRINHPFIKTALQVAGCNPDESPNDINSKADLVLCRRLKRAEVLEKLSSLFHPMD